MEALYTVLLGCLVIGLLTGGLDADLGVKGDALDQGLHLKKDVDSINGTNLSAGGTTVLNSDATPNRVDKVNNEGSGDGGEAGKQVADLGSSRESKGEGKDGKNDEKKSSSTVGKTGDPKVSGTGGNAGTTTPLRKGDLRVEECDPSHQCTAENGKLVACLRFPGIDSPKLSLLIQNKGKDPLTVRILAPDFVELKETKVQVKEKENREVLVSVGKMESQGLINLTAGTDSCSLDFVEMILHSTRKDFDGLPSSKPTNYLRKKPMTAFIFFAALLVLAAIGAFIGLRKKLRPRTESKYQRLDMMELPVSAARKPDSSDFSEGWDDSWGDGWDDEEVPKTPLKPVTPSVSSKGLTPRRATKEGWKD